MILKGTRCYLVGPVEHDESATSWRQEVAEFLSGLDVQVYDPLIKPTWLDPTCRMDPSLYLKGLRGETTEITPKGVVEANHMLRVVDLRIVHAVDWLICYLPKKFTAGSFEEVYEALRVGKPVYFCCPEGVLSTWLLAAAIKPKELGEYFFPGWDTLKTHILEIDRGYVELDPIRWIFLAWRKEDWGKYPLKTPEWR